MAGNRRITEDDDVSTKHIYVDDNTGDEYIFDGKKLVKISSGKPTPQNKNNQNDDNYDDWDKDEDDFDDEDDDDYDDWDDDEDSLEKEDREREEQARKEAEEDGEEVETEEERQHRLDKIRQFLDDENVGNQIKNDSEVQIEKERERKKAAAEKELRKNLTGAAKNTYVIRELCNDIRKFLAKVVGQSDRNSTWKKYNGNYDGSGLVRPGYRYEKIGKIPLIQIYIDQSGSWDESEIKIGQDILASIKEFEQKKLIKTEVYYFANHVHSDAATARREGGTRAAEEIMQQLNEMKPDNVIVITDDDFDGPGWEPHTPYEAPGGVWLVFREDRSKELMAKLHGKMLTKYYDIDMVRG